MPLDENKLETLEDRTLLSSVTLDDNRLVVVGNVHSHNIITIRYSRGGDNIVLVLNGMEQQFKKNDVSRVDIFGGNVHDDIEVLPTRNLFDLRTTIRGGGGDDLLVGSTESDLIIGDAGNDTIIGGPQDDDINGLDTVMGGNGNDVITVDADTALVFGGRGNDVITGTTRHGYIWGNEGNDVLDVLGDRLILLGNSGDDTITGTGGDTIYGGGGADVFQGDVGKAGEIKDVAKLQRVLLPRIPTIQDP